MPLSARGFVAGHYALELDGVAGGWLHSAEGGHATSDVVIEKLGPDHIARKHISGVKYEDITLIFGTGMSKGCYQWIKDSLDYKYSRKGGAVIACNYDHKEISRLTWYHGLISEVGLPACDAGSKDAAKMTVKLSPETTRTTTQAGGGKSVAGAFPVNSVVQKKWLPSNFRIRIDSLEEPCTKVNKIEAITVKQKNVENAVGEMRDYEKEPANLEIPNLVITVPESHADPFYKWHEDFVIKGNAGDGAEKNGALEFLTPNLQEVLFVLTFGHLGIFKMTPDKVESHNEGIRRIKIEMYCETMHFDYKAAWA